MAEGGSDDQSRAAVAPADSPSDQEAAAFTLQWRELDAFLRAHPDARLVDVREAAEHQASQGIRQGAWVASSLPLSAFGRLPFATPELAKAPVVVVCRSGNRSLKAAHWLRRLGHQNVRHVQGGLAMRDLMT
jgi:rhodanese-related sulfurtransferase